MARSKEENRRKDNCIECTNFKPIKAKGMCQNCWHKVKRKTNKNFWLGTRYTEIFQRCNNENNTSYDRYQGREVCTREEFKAKFINDAAFNYLFEQWKENNYDYLHTPSIDRIDATGGYTLDNMQALTHSDNSSKDQIRTPVKQFTKSGEYIRSFESQHEAQAILGIPQANIWKVCNKLRHTAGGFKFEYA